MKTMKMNIKKYICAVAIASMTGLFCSCDDYLDVSKELAQNLDKEEVFSNVTYLKKWYGELYSNLPNYSETGLDVGNTAGGFFNSWAILSGELVCPVPSVLKHSQNPYTPKNTAFNRWATCYKEIRQANIFLKEVPESLGDPGDDDSKYLSPNDIRRMKADAIYLKAYYYFLLFELYGPVPLMYDEIADPTVLNKDYPRASVLETVEHIDELLYEVIDGEYKGVLPDTYKQEDGYNYSEMLRPTKAAALALRARLWVYAASPLFNGGYKEALEIKNKDGKRLFEDNDPSRWITAKEHLKTLLDFCEQNGMKLHESSTLANGEPDPNLSIYEIFQGLNDEIIWANPNNDYSSTTYRMEPRTAPYGLNYYTTIGGNVGPYQEMVDMFFTQNGLTIDEENPAIYNETGFTDIVNPCSGTKHKDKQIYNMYVNREPRFYAAVTYEGKSWHIQPTSYPDFGAYFSKASKSSYKGEDTNARSGYLLYKFNHRKMMSNSSGCVKSWIRPWVYFRLADFYLYYAEVLNEIDPKDKDIILYLDKVRNRAGIPGYQKMNDDGTKTGVIGDQDAQREAIYRERIVELFGEGNYYFDTHRWMRAGWTKAEDGKTWIKDNEDKNLIRTGMDITKITVEEFTDSKHKAAKTFVGKYGPGTFYNRTVIDRYPWKKAMLLYPVPYAEMQKSELLVQNPLWID